MIEQFQIGEVLFGDDARGYVVGIELRPLQQVQQKVERAFVDRQLEARGRFNFWPGLRLWLRAHSSIRASVLMIGLITASTESVYSSTSRIRNP